MSPTRFMARFMAMIAAMLMVVSSPALAQDGTSARMKSVMPYLETFYKIPASERTLVQIVYRIKSKSLPEDQIKAWYELDGKRYELDLNDRGELWDVPDLKTYKANPLVHTNISRSDIVLATRVRPDIPLTTSMDAVKMRRALVEADKGIKSISGWFAFIRPKVKGYRIELKTGATAEIVYANGTTKPLTVNELNPLNSFIFVPREELEGAAQLNFSVAPHLMKFES